MVEELSLSVIIGIALGIIAVSIPIVYRTIKYIIDLHICVKLTKTRLEAIEKTAIDSDGTHSDIYEKVNKLERNLFHFMGKMKVEPID